MNKIAEFIKKNRRAAGLTQEEFAIRSGLGLRFVRELEQGKETVRMDKVNITLAMFDMEAVPGRKDRQQQNVRKKDFLVFADTCGITKNAAEKMIAKIIRMKPIFMQMCIDSYLPQHMKEQLNELIKKRCSVFTG